MDTRQAEGFIVGCLVMSVIVLLWRPFDLPVTCKEDPARDLNP